jgi:hypothetical protein
VRKLRVVIIGFIILFGFSLASAEGYMSDSEIKALIKDGVKIGYDMGYGAPSLNYCEDVMNKVRSLFEKSGLGWDDIMKIHVQIVQRACMVGYFDRKEGKNSLPFMLDVVDKTLYSR